MQTQAVKIPLKLIALDSVGAILAGLGLAKYFAGVDVLPTGWLFDESGLALIVIGFLLMLPMIIWLLGRAKQNK